MNRRFDPDAVRAQIENLNADRVKIDRAIESLEAALQAIEGIGSTQREFDIDLTNSETTLYDAVKRACIFMKDGIVRQRVIGRIEREHPFLKPKSASVAAALVNLTKGDQNML